MRRYYVPPFFGLWDARVHHLEMPGENWEESVKSVHLQNRARIIDGLKGEYGTQQIEARINNFKELGDAPMSIVSYHNLFFRQAREAFIVEAYYPALTGACALGERILNHLILDLRDHFRSRETYKEVHRKEAIDDWDRAIGILEDWGVLEPGIGENFQGLKSLRHKSLHFNPQTYVRVRDDAFEALKTLKSIIVGQFAAYGTQRWFIPGTKGACFIRKVSESDPFVKTFYLQQCPYIGHKYTLRFLEGGAVIAFDQESYDEGSITDEEYCNLYNHRKIADLVSSDLPPAAGIVTWLLIPGKASRVILESTTSLTENGKQA
jgi:hypothetical protein